jgi:hypothetical protein
LAVSSDFEFAYGLSVLLAHVELRFSGCRYVRYLLPEQVNVLINELAAESVAKA